MKAIAVSFSLRDQSPEEIIKKLDYIKQRFYEDDDVLLIHGNLPKDEVIKDNLPQTLVDGMKKIFPLQLNLWKGGSALRPEMGYFAKALHATVFVIGRKDGHVAEEISIYERNNIEINYVSLTN